MICNLEGVMKKNKAIDGLWITIVAFFIGGCVVLEMNPFGVGFIAAVSMSGTNGWFPLAALLFGMFEKLSFFSVLKYILTSLCILVISSFKTFALVRGRELALSGLSAMLLTIINLSFYYAFGGVELKQIPIEAALVFSSTMIFYYGIKTIKEDYSKIIVENEALISVFLLGVAALYGMPVHIFGEIVLVNAVSFFSIVLFLYKFGFGIGIIWTVATGLIISFKMDELMYLPAMLILAIISFSVLCVLKCGRLLFTVIFLAVYYILGIYWYEFLLEEENIKAVASAIFLFLLFPNRVTAHVDGRIGSDELTSNSPEWGRLIIERINGLASAFKRIEYTLAGSVNTGIGFSDVGVIIENFTNQLEKQVPLRKTIEANIIEELNAIDVQVKNLILIRNNDDRIEVYITSKVRRGRIVAAETVRKIIEKEIKITLEVKDESRQIVGHNYEMLCFREKPEFICKTAVRRLSRYTGEVSGDNFYIGEIVDGQQLVMIADGMGNGEKASADSSNLLEILEELLQAGFDKEISIKLVNSYLASLNKGETFSTLDMLLIDLHSGAGRMYKQGAATSYVKRGEWLEMIKSTSLPVGVIEGAVCEKCVKKFYKNDIIVMVSDGILESVIFENKDDYLRDILCEMELDEPEDIVEYVIEKIKSVGGNRLRDDATIIACKLVKTL